MKIAKLPYHRNSADLFGLIANEDWSIFLDSAHPYIDKGRYDILAARPYQTLVTRANQTTIQDREGKRVSSDDPFALVQLALSDKTSHFSGLPFSGGALGYFAYDLGRRLEKLPALTANELDLPDMAIGLYDWAVIVDHHQRSASLVGLCEDERTTADWQQLQALFHSDMPPRLPNYSVETSLSANMQKADYARAFARIKDYIYEGDCYQVNLAQRFSVGVSGDPWDIYLQLRRHNPAPYAGFMRLPDHALLSSSPERFISVVNQHVEAKPIKGTIERARDLKEDRALAEKLLGSEKDRAENLMIVDLLRNDIGKNCATGSVAVPSLFALESYASVHHLVSTVTGRLAQEKTVIDLLRGCFPGGSITGAPKLRAMEIIEELEPYRRHAYCGSLAYIGFGGNMDSNIGIRTLLHHQSRIYYWAGGGIVADSDMEAEYQECFTKAAAIAKLFQRESIQQPTTIPLVS